MPEIHHQQHQQQQQHSKEPSTTPCLDETHWVNNNIHRVTQHPRINMSFSTLKIKKRHLYSTFLASTVCFFVLLATMPIKWTPVVTIFPYYRTWHQVSSLHLMKVLMTSTPSGVTPIKNCSALYVPKVTRKDITQLQFNVFSYSRASSMMKKLHKINKDVDMRPFLPILDKETKITLLHTYRVLEEALTNAGVNHVLLHGSLLGVYRFRGLLPWDDDVDVAINVTKWAQVRDALSCIKGFELFVDPAMRWSFFPSNAPTSAMPGKKYPFIDIFFQAEDETHVWGLHKVNRRRSLFPKSKIFPTTWAYLDGIKVPVPHAMEEILKSQYGNLKKCSSQRFGHLVPSDKVHKVLCSELYPVYGDFSLKF